MMVDNEFDFAFHKYLEDEYKSFVERLVASRFKSLEEVYELQGKIRMLRNTGEKFKELTKAMIGAPNV